MKDVEIIGMLKSFVKATLVGMGALKGAPCQCVITTNADGTHKVTMMWVDNEGNSHSDSFDVLNGKVGDLKDLGDVTLAGLQEGQTLSWDAAKQKWVNKQNSATVNTLNAVGDVTITSVQDGEVLVWDDTASKWVNKALTASDISGLANVATSGDYDDLSNKPTIPAAQVQSDWNESDNTKADFIKNKPTLANVATSGDYDDLSNKPTIPAAQVQSDWNESDNTKLDFIKNKPSLLELGETSSKAYRGDRGKTAYDHSQIANGTNPHGTTADNVNLATALTINGASKTTAEAAISALAGLVDNITDTEYNAISAVLGN